MSDRTPIPPGVVSRVRGRWQRPVLTWTTRALLVVALVSVVVPDPARTVLAVAVVAAVVAAPLLRVAWLVLRWTHEHDRRFAVAGTGLLAVIGLGGTLAALGVGG